MTRLMCGLRSFSYLYSPVQCILKPRMCLWKMLENGRCFYHAHTINDIFDARSENSQAWKYMKSAKPYLGKIATDELITNMLKKSNNLLSGDDNDNSALRHFTSILGEEIVDRNLEIDFDSNSAAKIVSKINSSSMWDSIILTYILGKWPLTSKSKSTIYYEIWNALDERSCAILENQTVDDALLIADCWFHLRLSRLSKYNERMIYQLLFFKLEKLSSSEFVQLMFYVNLERSLPAGASAKAEKKFSQVFNALSIEEIGIVSLGFFKTKNGIHSLKLLQMMMYKLTSNLSNVDDFTFTSIVKCIRKSTHIQSVNTLIQSFLMSCSDHVDRLNVRSCMHLGMLGTYQQVYNKEVISKVLKKCAQEIQSLRLKDLAQLVFTASLFSHKDNSEFIDQMIKELHLRFDTKEVEDYPRAAVTCLLSLTYYDIYVEDLISKVFSPFFLDNLESKRSFDASRDLISMHYGLKVDCPNYNGNVVPRDKLNLYLDHIESLSSSQNVSSFQHKMTQSVLVNLHNIFGHKENIAVSRMLPHFNHPDVYAHVNKGRLPHKKMRFPNQMERISENKWTCFLIGGKNSYIYQSGQPTGLFRKKKNQLIKLGYRVIEVPWFEYWNKQSRDQKAYLEEKLF